MFNLLAFILWVGLKIESKLQGQYLIHVWEPVEHTEDAVAHFGTLPKDQLSQMLASHSLKLTFLRQSAVLFAEADFKKHNLEESSYIKVAVTIKDGSILPEYYGCTALFLDWFFVVAESWKYLFLLMTKNVKNPKILSGSCWNGAVGSNIVSLSLFWKLLQGHRLCWITLKIEIIPNNLPQDDICMQLQSY